MGRSLGIDPIPPKTCNFSCVYCQLGRTTQFINDRRDFFPRKEIFQEIQERIHRIGIENIDYITFVGDGEPTLCRSLGWLLEQISAEFSRPTAVITNGALLYEDEVQEELSIADIVLPTLDAGYAETFKKINRPHPQIQFQTMIEGMTKFGRLYSGEIWLEFMAVQGLNDNSKELQQVSNHIARIKPAKVYVNIPIRPPAEPWVKSPTQTGLHLIREILGNVVEIILPENGKFQLVSNDITGLKEEIVQIIRRHPMRLEQIQELLQQKGISNSEYIIKELERLNLIKHLKYENTIYFVSGDVKRGK